MNTKTSALIVTLITVVLNIGLMFFHVPQAITCQISKIAASVAFATSTN